MTKLLISINPLSSFAVGGKKKIKNSYTADVLSNMQMKLFRRRLTKNDSSLCISVIVWNSVASKVAAHLTLSFVAWRRNSDKTFQPPHNPDRDKRVQKMDGWMLYFTQSQSAGSTFFEYDNQP